MATQEFTTTITVDQTPHEVFKAVGNVRGWWSENIQGGTEKLGDEFIYKAKDLHKCTMRLIEVIPDKKIVWQVLDNSFGFTKDQTEWEGTKPQFEITQKEGKTQLQFTHQGLLPDHECYPVCHKAWTGYIQDSLRNLITTGKGAPNPKEEGSFQDAHY